MTLRQTLQFIAADTRERARLENKRFGLFTYCKLLINPPALAIVIFRLQHWLHTSGWRRLADCVRRFNVVVFSTDIGSGAVIAEHFILLHANGIFIGDRVRIGRNVYLVHHNTIAPGPRPGELPTDEVVIEDNVIIGCGARVLGNLSIGHDSFLGAGAVVTTSLPECTFHFAGPGEVNPFG